MAETPLHKQILILHEKISESCGKLSVDSFRVCMNNKKTVDKLCDIIRQNACDLYRYLGPGHLEKVYENGLVHRLTKRSLSVQQQLQLPVQDEDGTVIGNLIPDLLIEKFLIVECKSVQQIIPVHEAQILGYLRSANLKYGLLINFGTHRFSIKRYVSTPFQRQGLAERKCGSS